MAATYPVTVLQLPWALTNDDQRFKKILSALLLLFVALAIPISYVTLPELTRAEKEALPPQLARVVLEQQVLPPPVVEPPKVEEAKPEEVKPEPKKPDEPVVAKPPEKSPVKPSDKPVTNNAGTTKDVAVAEARERAGNSGLMQFKDDLAEMRDTLQTSAIETAETTTTNSGGQAATVDRAMITSGVTKGSGGISTAGLSRDTGGSALSGRETTRVKSGLAEGTKKSGQATAGNSNGTGGAARSEEEIRKIMEQHKGAIYSIYNRALRQNAALEGKMVVKIVIDPNGKIVEASLVSSELGDKDLEAKILQRIKLISFPASNVARTTLNQTFDFLPQ
ncbi:MAG: AgmX/PglI C-terminal domain-containing protein [Cellvibrio sp.]|uniref:AgmX/PglI C-terminal domain-containing protein n=1 Tax=Cellvibrio sp. TaxID=1965322 RepID=UPI0031A68B69